MAKRIKFCTRCMTILRRGDEKCSNCGLEVAKMQEEELNKNLEIDKKAEELAQKDLIEREMASEQKVSESNQKTEDSVDAKQNLDVNDSQETTGDEQSQENQVKRKRHKHKPKKVRIEDRPQYTVEEDGSFNIDTSDVTYLEDVDTKSYSVKKARGEAPVEEKLKWWEIYKWADRMLARRKIKKEVKKASYKVPYAINKTATLIWCIFFGWLGIHNFYACNYKKGWTVVAFDVIITLTLNIPELYEFMGVFVGGGLGFVVLVMWLKDLFNLIINRYSYRVSKEEFISNLNIETRAKLGKKYITFDRKVFKDREEKRLRKHFKKLNKKKLKAEKKNNEAK